MPTVYRVTPDWALFQSLAVVDPQALQPFQFNGEKVKAEWPTPRVRSTNTNLREGDFWGCFGNPSLFALSMIRTREIVSFIDQSCEVLPVTFEDERDLAICHVTYVLNCLDVPGSRFSPSEPKRLEKYVFKPHRFSRSLFRIPQTRESEILCVEDHVARCGEFKGTIETHRLKGLRFEKLWSNE